jgi:hypothetical protein
MLFRFNRPCVLSLIGALFFSIGGCSPTFRNASDPRTAASVPEARIIQERVQSISSLDARVTKVLFFESGRSSVMPPETTTYRSRFAQADTRTVYTEIHLDHPPPGKRVDFTVAVYIRENGTTFRIEELDARVEGDWTASYHRIGGAHTRPGRWRVGMYNVEVQINGEMVATGSFEIY